jgi:hypothetical protein
MQSGLESTYGDAMVAIRNLEKHLEMTDKEDYPLLKAVGLNSYDGEAHNVKVEWEHDYGIPLEDTLAAAVTDDPSQETEFTVSNAAVWQKHDTAMLDSEMVRVTDVDIDAGTITVERGFASTTAATHSSGATLYRMGTAREEGSGVGWGQQVKVSLIYNLMQIFDALVEMTGTDNATTYYGTGNKFARNLDKKLKELYQLMSRSLAYGRRYQPSANTGRMAGGLAYFIHDQRNQSGGELTGDTIKAALKGVFDRAGLSNVPKMAWGNSTGKARS